MADTYTSSLRLQQPTIGGDAATWGGYLNTDLVLIDNAINGVATINLAGLSAYTLTVGNGVVDQARNFVYNFTGALSGDCTVTLPQSVKFGYAVNSTTGGHHVILTTGSGGTTLSLPTAAWYQFFYCDSSNVLSPSIGFGYANFLNDVAVNGALSVTGTTTMAGTLNGQAINGTTLAGSTSVACGSWFVSTNGDQHIPYLSGNLSSFLNQSVTSTASPVFADVGISGLGFLKASFLNQAVKTTSGPTFAALAVSGAMSAGTSTLSSASIGSLSAGNTSISGTLSAGSTTINGTLNVSSTVGFTSSLSVGGAIGAATLSVSSSFSGSTSGWQLTPTGTGSFSGGFNLSISSAQGVLGNTFIAASDARVKEDIEPISGNEGLRFVRSIGAKTYRHDGALSAGFVAQDAIRNDFQRMVIISDSSDPRVAEGDDVSPAGKRLNLNYDCATAYHHAALSALLSLVEELQDEVASLKAARS